MSKIKAYFRKVKTYILLFILPVIVNVVVLYVFNISATIIIYLISLSLFLGMVMLVVGWLHYERDLTLQVQYELLQEENKKLVEQFHLYRNDIENYFLMWLHQMKTPIAAAQLLLRDEQNEQTKELRLLITDIEKYTGMALSYIKLNNPSTDLDFAKIKMDTLIQPLLKKYRYQFIHRKIKLNYQPIQAIVLTDGHWTSIMIEQLLSNALKYSKQGGEITIQFDEQTQQLAIVDNGVGIQAHELPKIFDKGYVGFNGRLHEKASGLGLYLVDLIAKRLEQPISVQSTINVGSTFYIAFGDGQTSQWLE